MNAHPQYCALVFLSQKLPWHFSSWAQEFQTNVAIYSEGRWYPKTEQQMSREFCDSASLAYHHLHTSPSILILDFILILSVSEVWQNISKVKWRGKATEKRDPPSLLETILFQNGFCYRVGHFCFFLGLLFSARQVWHPSSHTCFFIHSVVSSSYVVSLPPTMGDGARPVPEQPLAKAAVTGQFTSSKTPWQSPLEGKDMALFNFQLVTRNCSLCPEPLSLGRFLLASLCLMGHPLGLFRQVVPIIRRWGITSKTVAFKYKLASMK